MTVLVGGDEFPVEPWTTVLRLLAELRVSPRQLAVDRNRHLMPLADFADTRLASDDRVEVVISMIGLIMTRRRPCDSEPTSCVRLGCDKEMSVRALLFDLDGTLVDTV